jgi:hypothetical protein
VFVAKLIVIVPLTVLCVIALYVAYERGTGERPERNVVGVPQFVLKTAIVGDVGQLPPPTPPNPVNGVVAIPFHDARVTNVHEEAPGVLPVPLGHAMHALTDVAVAPPRE